MTSKSKAVTLNARRTEPLPVERLGNGENIVSLDFDKADLLMLMASMRLASCTAYMCGGEKAARRFSHYEQAYAQLLPEGAKLFDREEQLAEIIYAIREHKQWSQRLEGMNSWNKKGASQISVNGKIYTCAILSTIEDHEGRAAAVRELVPLDAIEEPWGQNDE